MSKRKNKAAYDPFKLLYPQSLPLELEEQARRLYELACCGANSAMRNINPEDLKTNITLRKDFFTLSHKGMRAAQNEIINSIQTDKKLNDTQLVLFKAVADSMAWQLIGSQLCYARRLYKEHSPVNLRHSNFESVITAANYSMDSAPGSFALISDLTSFVQIGDLLTMGALGGVGISEVKEGKKNHEIMEFMRFFMESNCPHSLYHFAQQHGQSGIKQLQRMLRQTERMGHVSDIMSKGRSIDPDTKVKIHIPEETVYIDNWDQELSAALNDADSKGWSYNVIDSCLYLGVYCNDKPMGLGHGLFNILFDNAEGTPKCPRVSLIDTLKHPLAPPIFNWHISEKHKFDILFGRKNVCVGLNITAFLKQLVKTGFSVREGTNKEASQLDQAGSPPYRHKGKAIFVKHGNAETPLMDGVFLRVLYHTQKPIETMRAILNSNFDDEPPSDSQP